MRIVKILMVVLLLGFIVMLSLNTTSSKPASSVEKDLLDVMNEQLRTKGSFKELKRFYGLYGEDYDSFVVYAPKSAMDAEDLLVVKANTPEQADAVMEAVDKRIADQIKIFEGYGEKQIGLLKDAHIRREGNYVFYAVGKDADALEKAFKESVR